MADILKAALAIMAFIVVFSIPAFASFSVSISSPANTTYTTTFSNPVSIPVNYTFAGNETLSPPCFWQLDGGSLTQLTLCQNFTNSFNVGYHSLKIYANSTFPTSNSTTRNFTVYSNFTFFNASINNVIPNVIVPIIADTYVENGNCAGAGLSGSYPDGNQTFDGFNSTLNHGSERYLIFSSYNYPYLYCQYTFPTTLYSLWKVNITNSTYTIPDIVQNKVIEQGYFQGIGATNCGGSSASNKTLYWSPSAGNWNESNITFSNCGSVCSLDVAGSANQELPRSGIWGAENFVNNQAPTYFFSSPDVVQSIYNSTNGLMTFAMNNNDIGVSCTTQAGWNTWKWTYTKEAATPNYAQANFTLVDFISSGNDYPLFSAVFTEFYYDFETGSINSQGAQSATPLSSSFQQADFKWSLSNILTPLNGAMAVIATGGIQNDTTNTLANVACAGETGYSTSPIYSLNVPAGKYYVICFNLTANHNGHPFFGAIKVNNAQTDQILGVPVGGDFNFWAALYSPAFTSFSIPTRIPATVNGGDNVSYFWQSSQPTTTGVQYFITPSGGSTTVVTIVSDGNLTLSHAYTISGALLAPATQVTFRVFGVTNDSTTIWSPYVDYFTVEGATGIQNNLTDIIEPINGGSGGLGIFPFTELGYTSSGFVNLDNTGWVHTTLTTCDNCTFQILWNETSSFYIYKPQVHYVQYTPDLAGIGTHNIKIRDDSGYRYRDYNFTIPYNPYALAIRVLPNTCIPYNFWGTEDFCRNDMISLNLGSYPNATGQFCQFNPTECQLYNYTNGQCIQYAQHVSSTGSGLVIGGWVHYICFNDVNSGYYNQSIVNGTPLTGGTSPSDQLGNIGANFLGITPEAFKATIAMIIILIITGLMAWKTKDGLISGIFFEGGMGLFLLMGWLPLWFLIVFGVLAAFMIAKFARHLIAPSGGD